MTNSLQDELRKAIRMKGRVAFRNRIEIEKNPYVGNDEALQDWRDGWLEASEEVEKTK